MVLQQIYKFLKVFSDIVSDNHKIRLINIQSHLENINNLKKIKNKFGEHYDDCVWSDENSVGIPHTCQCMNRETVEEEAVKLMNLYYNTYNVSKCKNCNFNKI